MQFSVLISPTILNIAHSYSTLPPSPKPVTSFEGIPGKPKVISPCHILGYINPQNFKISLISTVVSKEARLLTVCIIFLANIKAKINPTIPQSYFTLQFNTRVVNRLIVPALKLIITLSHVRCQTGDLCVIVKSTIIT